jgi:hypothetical protein
MNTAFAAYELRRALAALPMAAKVQRTDRVWQECQSVYAKYGFHSCDEFREALAKDRDAAYIFATGAVPDGWKA